MMNFIAYASKGKRAAEAAPYGVVDLLSVGGLGLGGLVSLLFSDYLYAGGANGLDVKTGLTISSITGRTLQMEDLFASDASYKEALDRNIREQLKDRGLEGQLLSPFTGITGKENFYITDSALVIVIRELEWFPHSMGTVEFSIPFTEIQMYLKEDLGLS